MANNHLLLVILRAREKISARRERTMKHNLYFEALRPYLEKRRRLRYLINLVYYDLATAAPSKSIEDQSNLLAFYDSSLAAMAQETSFKNLVKRGLEQEELSSYESRLFISLDEEISLMEKVSLKDYASAKKSFSKSNEMWRIYRGSNNFAKWLPYWEECVKWARVLAKARMGNEFKTPYDALLDSYEPGETSEYLDSFFSPIKKAIIRLLPMAISKQAAHSLPAIKPVSIAKQLALSYDLLDLIGFDKDGGTLKVSAHPFSSDISRFDARLTTKYSVNDYRSNLFTILHEGGHCLQFQNKSDEEYDNFVENLATAANCETHSRFYENLVGRSEEFAPVLKKMVAKDLDPGIMYMSDDDFYLTINRVEPGLIRTEADELTYTLHIIIRYEIERDLINGKIECKDVPAIWKEKYKSYLGVDVDSDKDGCMQDIHWTDAEFGYFPSYALGNIYGAEIREKMNEEIGLLDLIQAGKMGEILSWLKENDFAYDYLSPSEWMRQVIGKEASSTAFISYLNNKFGKTK